MPTAVAVTIMRIMCAGTAIPIVSHTSGAPWTGSSVCPLLASCMAARLPTATITTVLGDCQRTEREKNCNRKKNLFHMHLVIFLISPGSGKTAE